jgi:hypothetical protein
VAKYTKFYHCKCAARWHQVHHLHPSIYPSIRPQHRLIFPNRTLHPLNTNSPFPLPHTSPR